MELDDLKQTWKQADKKQKIPSGDITELIQNKSFGPFAALKKRFRKQIVLVIFTAALLINNLSRNHQIFTDVLFWSYIAFCIALCLFFYLNYRLVSKMLCMDGMIKFNLERQVAILEKRLKMQLVGIRIIAVLFIVLSEVLPYLDNEPMLEKWHSLPPLLRLLVYVTLLVSQYFISKAVSQRRYGQHLSYIKNLLNEMQS